MSRIAVEVTTAEAYEFRFLLEPFEADSDCAHCPAGSIENCIKNACWEEWLDKTWFRNTPHSTAKGGTHHDKR